MLYKALIRPVMYRLSAGDPEDAHHWLMNRLAWISHYPALLKTIEVANAYNSHGLARDVFGVHFPNPVGLAGGFDKNGIALPALAAMGFGFIEAGTVTRYAQPGNERPRIFRFSENDALINRMGFPNDGADAVAQRLSRLPRPSIPIGWSIGKSKVTPQEEAIEDYLYSLHKLHDFSNFFTVNVSSPNTPGLRKLQDKEPLDRLLHAVVQETQSIAAEKGTTPKPVLVKIAPDLTQEQIDDVIEVCLARGIRGIIATNTTLSREGLTRSTSEAGGLSGRPLHTRSLEIVRYLCLALEGKIPVIGVGGIFGPDDARRMFDAGASLIQIYTSFIYEGPGIVKQLNKSLDAK
ncbi:dihydroorotate dehydrogenase (quinone) [Ktedonobacter sp. SOSP1-85]|uniref:quinone-dependent dihydroorotate dehydrogenase n=1 Tax=Ktedonobacter sp. SOSP1-85 TaxID=2778367 RepID=UPI0019151ED0|nr:quinone-dependent dihydroorotate dehydrogenase [Ktedonobacter sp. SOSP1-85]GHO79050.1 dihydroorotate dehydrogenase (quinone) [Ktedonobacter sp. SOSP1-85]